MTGPAAPIPHDELAAVLAPEFGQARTLPARAYRSEAVLEWERCHLFDAGWVCVGRSDLAGEPRSQRAIRGA